ncbi:hypothetical protein ACP4OV_012378 [Aristida adscensionis]
MPVLEHTKVAKENSYIRYPNMLGQMESDPEWRAGVERVLQAFSEKININFNELMHPETEPNSAWCDVVERALQAMPRVPWSTAALPSAEPAGLVPAKEETEALIGMVECCICQEDPAKNLESPCACSGSLKYAHRECVQRWCNEKGDNL